MAKRPLQEINAGSMADIAFLLLIFFLVTTTMSTNTGLQRKLPPPPEDPPPDIEVIERNVMVVLINKDNNIMINRRPVLLTNVCEKGKEFFSNPNNSENLPQKKEKEIPFFGTYMVSKGIVSLQTDRNTNYEKYLQVQNELVRAINELRDELSLKKFGMKFKDLDDDKHDAVGDAIPLAISEAEPRRMTGTGGN